MLTCGCLLAEYECHNSEYNMCQALEVLDLYSSAKTNQLRFNLPTEFNITILAVKKDN